MKNTKLITGPKTVLNYPSILIIFHSGMTFKELRQFYAIILGLKITPIKSSICVNSIIHYYSFL